MSKTQTISIRKQQEEFERDRLSPHAVLSSESLGRRISEEECPLRTKFQRDRDRIIHSKAFRRLKHKTQVFLDPEEDHYRTRLTHTLEVSQISRTIARALRLNEDLVEAISLGHDLGHTPFGHAGERALDEIYSEYVPDARFRHNEQSLRVVDILERDGEGLNLTHEVREGILHHSKGSNDLDLTAVNQISLEAQVVRISDRIAYINHDIDDSIRAGMLSISDLPSDCVGILGEKHSKRIATMVIDIVENSKDKSELGISPEIMYATDKLKDFMFERIYGPDTTGWRSFQLQKAANLVKSLFRLFFEDPSLLKKWYPQPPDNTEEWARLVCDFIAGMTDRYAQGQYVNNFIPESFGTD